MKPSKSLEGLYSSFSPDGTTYALATTDGRLRLYDSGNGRLIVSLGSKGDSVIKTLSNGNYNETVTSLSWVLTEGNLGNTSVSGLIAGTASGHVQLYDVQRGETLWRTQEPREGGVFAVAYSAQRKQVFCSGRSPNVTVLSGDRGVVEKAVEASRYAITSLAISPDDKFLLIGGSTFQLLDATSLEREAKYTGHPNEAVAVAFVPGLPYFVSAGAGERHVAVWRAPPAKRAKGKQNRAAATLPLEEPAAQLDAVAAAGGKFYVSAVTESGVLHVWALNTATAAEEKGETVEAELVLKAAIGSGKKDEHSTEVILGAKLQLSLSGTCQVLVARGTTAKPSFETLAVPSSTSAGVVETLALAPIGGVLLGKGTTAAAGAVTVVKADKSIQQLSKRATDAVTIVGVVNEGQPVLLRGAGTLGSAPAPALTKGAKRAAADEVGETPADAVAPIHAMDEDDIPELPEGEETLGERVRHAEQRLSGAAAGAAEPAAHLPSGSAKADSLSVLLTQAIRSNDAVLLERCIASSGNNAAVINNTVARIVCTDAALFLRTAVDRLVARPAAAAQMVPWVRAVLHHHTGYIMSAPGTQSVLTALYQAVESRAKLQEPLLKAHGRLGLILSHTSDGATAAAGGLPTPEVVFEDDDEEEDEPEAEDAYAEDDEEEDEGKEGAGDDEDDEDSLDSDLLDL